MREAPDLGYVYATYRRLTDLFGSGETDDSLYSFTWAVRSPGGGRARIYTFHVDLSPIEMTRLRISVRNHPDTPLIWQITATTPEAIDHVTSVLRLPADAARPVTALLTRPRP